MQPRLPSLSEQKGKRKIYNTVYSQAVTHPSTNTAQCCLTSVIRRELVLSTWYGRRQYTQLHLLYLTKFVRTKRREKSLQNQHGMAIDITCSYIYLT